MPHVFSKGSTNAYSQTLFCNLSKASSGILQLLKNPSKFSTTQKPLLAETPWPIATNCWGNTGPGSHDRSLWFPQPAVLGTYPTHGSQNQFLNAMSHAQHSKVLGLLVPPCSANFRNGGRPTRNHQTRRMEPRIPGTSQNSLELWRPGQDLPQILNLFQSNPIAKKVAGNVRTRQGNHGEGIVI